MNNKTSKYIMINVISMNISIITKILGEILPEDIIREISSYFIQKISKNDIRYRCLNNFMLFRISYTRDGYYSDGEFRYKLFYPPGKRFFCLKILPRNFIEYHFCIDNRISSIRFWIKDNKCEVPLDGLWIEKKNK